MRQVHENLESTKRQYALQERAFALGWTQDQVVVIGATKGNRAAARPNRRSFQGL